MQELRTLNPEQVRHFQEEGYVVLEDWIDMEMVEALREIINVEMEVIHQRMDKQGSDVLGLNHRGSRYFIGHTHTHHQVAHEFAFGREMESICRSVLGDTSQLFLDQLLIKGPAKGDRPGLKFGWHQDAGYVSHSHPLYLTCWTALDDMSEENGTVRILPTSQMEKPGPVQHTQEAGTNDMVGYHGDHPGIPAIVKAGTVVAFSSYTFHCSGPNFSKNFRRAHLTQYSSSPIMNQEGTGYHIKAVPFLENGKRIAPDFKEPSTISA